MDYKMINTSEVIKSIGTDKEILVCVLEEIPGLVNGGIYDFSHLKIRTVASLLAEKNVVFFEKKVGDKECK